MFSNFSLKTVSAIRDRKCRVRLVLVFFKEGGREEGGGGGDGRELFTGIILSIKILEEVDSLDFVFLFDDGRSFSGTFSGWFFAFLAAGGLLEVDDG